MQDLTLLGRPLLQEVDAAGLGVERLDLPLEIVARRHLQRLLDRLELRPRFARGTVEVLRTRALDRLDQRAKLGEVRVEAVNVLAEDSHGIDRCFGLTRWLGASLDEPAAAGRADDQDRQNCNGSSPEGPQTAAAHGPASPPDGSHAHSPHRSTGAVLRSTNGPPDRSDVPGPEPVGPGAPSGVS
jgi:hypothetical protein